MSRRGPRPRPPEQRRTVDAARLRLTPAEAALVRERAAARGLTVGAYLRLAALDRVPPAVPELNRRAWAELARVAGNLNQLVLLVRRFDAEIARAADREIETVRRLVADLRAALIGARRALAEAEAEEDGP